MSNNLLIVHTYRVASCILSYSLLIVSHVHMILLLYIIWIIQGNTFGDINLLYVQVGIISTVVVRASPEDYHSYDTTKNNWSRDRRHNDWFPFTFVCLSNSVHHVCSLCCRVCPSFWLVLNSGRGRYNHMRRWWGSWKKQKTTSFISATNNHLS